MLRRIKRSHTAPLHISHYHSPPISPSSQPPFDTVPSQAQAGSPTSPPPPHPAPNVPSQLGKAVSETPATGEQLRPQARTTRRKEKEKKRKAAALTEVAGTVVDVHRLPPPRRHVVHLMGQTDVRKVALGDIAIPPVPHAAMGFAVREGLQVRVRVEVHDVHGLAGRVAVRGVEPAAAAEEAVVRRVRVEVEDQVFEVVGEVFEAGREHAEGAVGRAEG